MSENAFDKKYIWKRSKKRNIFIDNRVLFYIVEDVLKKIGVIK